MGRWRVLGRKRVGYGKIEGVGRGKIEGAGLWKEEGGLREERRGVDCGEIEGGGKQSHTGKG